MISQARHSLARQGHRLEQHQLVQQQQAHQRHQSYPQPQQSYHPTMSSYPNNTSSATHSNTWPPHSHSHSHPNASLPSSHSYNTQAVSLAPPAPVSYYDTSPDLNLAYNLPPTSTATSSSSLAPSANGLTSYSQPSPQSILSPSFSQAHSTSSNPAFYHYHQTQNGGGQLPPVNIELNGNGVNGYGQNGRNGGEGEIERLPSIVYGNGTI